MTSSRRQVLVGSLVLAAACIAPMAVAAPTSAEGVIKAMKALRNARRKAGAALGELSSKESKVVMKADLAPLAVALGKLAEAREELASEWKAFSQGKHGDVDDKLKALGTEVTAFGDTLATIPARSILTRAKLEELFGHHTTVRTSTSQIGDRIDEITG